MAGFGFIDTNENNNDGNKTIPFETEQGILNQEYIDTESEIMNYQALDTSHKKRGKLLWILGILVAILIGLIVYIIIDVLNTPEPNIVPVPAVNAPTIRPTFQNINGTCITQECTLLASEIINDANFNADPCDDFYEYVCGNFRENNEYRLIDTSYYNRFIQAREQQKQIFLDTMFYNTDANVIGNSTAISKAIDFFNLCHQSNPKKDENVLNNIILNDLINIINFTTNITNQTWNGNMMDSFQNSLIKLSQWNWNTLFTLTVSEQFVTNLKQNYDQWLGFNQTAYYQTLKNSYLNLYKQIFKINDTIAMQYVDDVYNFTLQLRDISTVNDNSNIINDNLLYNYLDIAFDSIIFRETFAVQPKECCNGFECFDLLDHVLKTFNASGLGPNDDMFGMSYYIFGTPYFSRLPEIICQTSPFIVQLYLLTNILTEYINYNDTLIQNRFQTRTDYCFDVILQEFPFVYGYILSQTIYNETSIDLINSIGTYVKDFGIFDALNRSIWLDGASVINVSNKTGALGYWVGYPLNIFDKSLLDRFYNYIEDIDISLGYMNNLYLMNEYNYLFSFDLFYGLNISYPLSEYLTDWPLYFQQFDALDSWLINVNAFYFDFENILTIPLPMISKPFFDPNNLPSINFGSIGAIIGHELSHSFDSQGIYYDSSGDFINGTINYTGIITTNAFNNYAFFSNCFSNSYNNALSSENINFDSNATLLQNIADNYGLYTSRIGFENYISDVSGNESLLLLPGLVNLTSSKLFWVSYARTYCEVGRDDIYQNWPFNNAPGKARVNNVIRNIRQFGIDFECKTDGSQYMFPKYSDTCPIIVDA